MATAEELLSGVLTVDKTLVISNDLRTISIPSSVRNLGVENDDDVLYLEFKMPRYIGNIDLSVFSIRINYLNAQGEGDIYTVTKPSIGDQYITFNWLVGPTATRYKGNTKFNVCLRTFASDGTVDREYNTTIATLPVLEGLEVDESYLESYSDLLEQWRRELFGIGDTEEASIKALSQKEQKNITDKGAEVLATIPADYTTAVSMTDNADRTKADAIICTAEGDVITVTDSSDDYIRGLRVFGKTTQVNTTGKQLININQPTKFSNGITFVPNPDGSVHVIGTATDNAYYIIDQKNPIEFKETNLIATLNGGEGVYMVIGYIRSDNTVQNDIKTVTNNGPETLVYPADAATTRTFLGVNKGITVNTIVYPMLRLATIEDDAMEPYSNGLPTPSPNNPSEMVSIGPDINVYVDGENILPYPYVHTTRTVNGCTFTDNGDGGIVLSGTPTSYADMTLTTTLKLNTDMTIALLGTYENVTLSIALQCGGNQSMAYVTSNPSKPVVLLKDDYPKNTIIELRLKRTGDNKIISGTAYPIVVRGIIAPTEYVSYTNTQTMQLNHTLHGIPDTNGQQGICDEVDFERGVYVQRIDEKIVGEADITNVNTAYVDYGTYTTVPLSGAMNNNAEVIAISDRLLGISADYRTGSGYDDKYRCYVQSGKVYLCFPAGTGEKTLDECRAAFVGTTIRYALATPVETPLTAEEIQWFRFAHTNFPNTTVINDAGATMQLKYNADTTTFLRECGKPADDQVQAAVDAWLTNHYTPAEGAKF